jgi:hypothetical protein
MRNQPAVFLKLLVLLVPREMKMEHCGGVKAMTDEKSNQIRSGPMVHPGHSVLAPGSDPSDIAGCT